MNKILLLLASISLSIFINAQTFTKEGNEIEMKAKYPNVDYLGYIGDDVLTYNLEIKGQFDFNFIKINKKTLEKISSKELTIKFNPYAYIRERANCTLDVFFKQNKIFILYSLLDTKGSTSDYRIFLKILNTDFEEISNEQIGLIHDTGYENQGKYQITFSQDNKTALLILKNLCEKKKAIGNYTDVYEKTELIWIDLISAKKTYSKFLPAENNESRIKTSNYQISNNGNLAFILMYFDINDHSKTNGVLLAVNKFSEEKFSAHEIKLNSKDSSITNSITLTKDEKAIYLCKTNYRYLYKTVNLNNCNIELDNEYKYKKSTNGELETDIKEIFETEGSIYFVGFKHKFSYYYGDMEILTVFKTNKNGELEWARYLPKKTFKVNAYSHLLSENHTDLKTIFNNEILSLIYLEDNIFPPTQNGNSFENDKQKYVNDIPAKNSNLVAYSLNKDGNITKKIIFENQKIKGIVPYNGYISLENGDILLNFSGPKKIQFATLKL